MGNFVRKKTKRDVYKEEENTYGRKLVDILYLYVSEGSRIYPSIQVLDMKKWLAEATCSVFSQKKGLPCKGEGGLIG